MSENSMPGNAGSIGGEAPVRTSSQSPIANADDATLSSGWAPPRNSIKVTIILLLVMFSGILVALHAWQLPPFSTDVQTTENAYVRGRTTIMSPQVSGYVISVPVQDFERVKAGQVLAIIDGRVYRQRVEQARANLNAQFAILSSSEQAKRSREAALGAQGSEVESARAQLVRLEADMRRVDELVGKGFVSIRDRDETRAALRAAQAAVHQAESMRAVARADISSVKINRAALEANVEGARAALKLAEIDLANTVIRASVDGQLGEVGVRVGQYVTAGSQLTFLVPNQLWVIANYKEAQTAHMGIGQPALITVDALGGSRLTGHVESLAPAAGSEFALFKPENATGNFVKVAQRISVRIMIDPNQSLFGQLRPGMSLEVRVDTSR